MKKEDLIRVICNHNKFLKRNIEQIKKDIEYQNDILKINEKHNRNTYEIKDEIKRLRIMLETLENTKSDFDETMKEYNVNFEKVGD